MKDAFFLRIAATEAERYVGATAPNPPVGACVARDGQVLGVGAHVRAGQPHAEVMALKQATSQHGAQSVRGATIYVTLEPCNHQGRTPPCTRAILEAGLARVVYAESDPNPNVVGGGASFLLEKGVLVAREPSVRQCARLIDGFATRARTGRPWVVHKLAYRTLPNHQRSMVPEPGQKAFTSEKSLERAHLERKKCDAILTDVATVLADNPSFNVRRVADHVDKKRVLAVLSRSGRQAPSAWIGRERELGFEVVHYASVETALDDLGQRGILRVLVEAGPTLSSVIETQGLWNERVVITQQGQGLEDEIRSELKSQEYA